MTFSQALVYLDSFVNYEKKTAYPYARSFKLGRMRSFLASLGGPHRTFRSIHVAGTKGKGSVCLFCSHILRESGLRVGLYTSPHLSDIRERIRILEPGTPSRHEFSGMISRGEFSALVGRLKPALESFQASSGLGPLSFFEVYTALAFEYFRERGVDCAVLETGMGGRLDATNVVEPAACCISSISIDHTQKLGRTLSKIAGEKAGIIKRGTGCVISAPQPQAAGRVIARACARKHVSLLTVGREITVGNIRRAGTAQSFDIDGAAGRFGGVAIRMLGTHQAVNAACAVALSVAAGRELGVTVNASRVKAGCAAAFWPGRFEILRGGFVLDGAHNGESARALARTLKDVFPREPLTIILGVSRDKKLDAICRPLLRVSRRFIVTRAANPRALTTREIARRIRALDPKASVIESGGVDVALRIAGRAAGVRCVTGSLFLVGEARELLTGKSHA